MHAALERCAALHGAVFFGSISTVVLASWPLRWPWYFLLPLVVYASIVLAWPPLRRTAPRLAVGRLSGWPLAVASALVVATSTALVLFHALAHPDVADLAAGLPVAAFGNLLLAGVCFSALNA